MADVGGVAADRLRSFVERIERLEEERRGLAGDIKDVYAEAKSAGFDTKTLRAIVAERREDAAEREERLALLDLYRRALGMLADTPLGEAAMGRVDADAPKGRGRGREDFRVEAARRIKGAFETMPGATVTLAPDLAAAIERSEAGA